MNYKKSYLLYNIGGIGGLISLLMGSFLTKLHPVLGMILSVIGVVVGVLAILQTILFYRCPYCGSRLDIRSRKPVFCPECGKKLSSDKD